MLKGFVIQQEFFMCKFWRRNPQYLHFWPVSVQSEFSMAVAIETVAQVTYLWCEAWGVHEFIVDTRLGQCHDWGIKEITCKINWFYYIHRPVHSGDSRPSIEELGKISCWIVFPYYMYGLDCTSQWLVSHGSLSLLYFMKVIVWHFVSDSCKVMIAPILV
jgi:hypothetical protein